ncbi:MAG TPA: biotin transporter BioY [Gemmatimonadota bacterium]|nr:biotin transporter BioY [Gemmatimonadota bacterium]
MRNASLSLDRDVGLSQAATGRRAAGIAAFVVLTAIGAFVRIPLPFTPVPITLQTFFVLASGIYLGGRDAALSQIMYLALGIVGLPVFAGSSGLAHAIGPTGGFLLAFPVAAGLVGRFVRPGDRLAKAAAVLLAADAVIFALGATWLALAMGIGPGRALALAVLPFLPGTVVKTGAALALVVRSPIRR